MTVRQPSILIVDPEPRASRQIGAILAERNLHVFSAESAAAAQGILARQSIDVLFAELTLPDQDGISFIAGLQREFPGMSLVAMTDRPSLESAVESLRNGACEYVFKPITPHKILSACDRAWAFQRRLHQAIVAKLPRREDRELGETTLAPPYAAFESPTVTPDHPTVTVALDGNFKTIERDLVRQVVLRFDGNKTAAAKALGMHRKSLYRVLERPGESE